MSCTLPGIWLVLRQQSMMGDALSHTALPGVVLSFLFGHWLHASGWISAEAQGALEPVLLSGGAVLMGILTAVLTEAVRKLGRVESSAALGVVFTSLFALGLLLIRLGLSVPRAALINGALLLVNALCLALFYKELQLASFDPELATTQGLPAWLVHYLLMGMAAATAVAAFESVGSILVVALLIVPAACGLLLCQRLPAVIAASLGIAASSALLGHVAARRLPPLIFGALGFPQVQDAGTPGMMAAACGLMFIACFLFAPRQGLISRFWERQQLTLKMAQDDVLATLFRCEEGAGAPTPAKLRETVTGLSTGLWRLTLWQLQRRGLIVAKERVGLTEGGRKIASDLVRAHRLWEAYLHQHFALPDELLHESAHLVEHFLDQDLRAQIEAELNSPQVDPHGKAIPPG